MRKKKKNCLRAHVKTPQSLTVELICAVSTVINAITFPEHGLTQSVFTGDVLRIALWRANIVKLVMFLTICRVLDPTRVLL